MQKTYSTEFDGVTVEVVVTDAIAYTDPDVIGNLRAYIDGEEFFDKRWAYTISGFYAVDEFGEEITLNETGSIDKLIETRESQLWSYIDNDLSDNGNGWDYIFQLYYQQIMKAKENFQN